MVTVGAGFHSCSISSGFGQLAFQPSCAISLATFEADGLRCVKCAERKDEITLLMQFTCPNELMAYFVSS